MSPRDERSKVSGYYAGPLTRLIGFAIDVPIIGILFAMMVSALIFTVNLVASWDPETESEQGLYWLLGLALWTFVYNWVSLSITGRTPGKALAGARIVEVNGNVLTSRQAFVRVIVQPFSFLFFGLGYLPMLLGKERRAMHDYAAHSAVVYDWGDRAAEIPAPLSRWLARSGVADTQDVDLRG